MMKCRPTAKLFFVINYLQIYIHSRIAYLMTSGRLVAIIQTGHSPVARGGALVTNGYENLVFFKSYHIYSPGQGRLKFQVTM